MSDEMKALIARKRVEAKDERHARELRERERTRHFKELTYVPPPLPLMSARLSA